MALTDTDSVSLTLAPTLGETSSTTEHLWRAPDTLDLTPDAVFDVLPSLEAEAEATALGLGLADGGTRDWRLGWRLTPAVPGDSAFEVNLDATRREAANDEDAAHGVMLRGAVR